MNKNLIYFFDALIWGIIIAALFCIALNIFTVFSACILVAACGYWTIRTIDAHNMTDTDSNTIAEENREIAFQKERFEAFIELSHDGIIILDKNNHILRINDAITEMTGYTPAEAVGKPCAEVFRCEKYRETGLAFGLAFLTDESPTHYEEVPLLTKEGRPIDVGVRCARAKHHPGHRGRSLVLVRDLSKIHEAESLEHDFVSMTSHQLFTPLSIIRGHLSMLVEGDLGKLNSKQIDFVDQSLESTKRMVHLVSELLSISRLEERKIVLNFNQADIVSLVKSAVSEMQPLAKAKHIELTYQASAEPLPVLTIDSEKMSQVIQNLIENSIKYTKDKGSVTVSLEAKSQEVVLKVQDTGIGISKEDLGKIFQRFYRGSNAIQVDAKGSGLGLYIARVIIERHNGKVWAESTEGKGSTFYVSLPR